MKDRLQEILKESNLQVLENKLDLFIHDEEYSEEYNILNFIEKTYLPNLRIKTKIECNNCTDSNEALLIRYTIEEKVLFLKKWIDEWREIIENRFPKTNPIKKRRESKEKDITNKGLESLKITVTPQYFIDHVKQYRKDLSEIDFAKECLSHKDRQIEIETQYNNFNALIFYKYYRDIIKDYLTSKGWSELSTPPAKKEKTIKYNAKECALSYVLDLYSIGNQIPTNRVEGSLDAKLLNKIGAEKIKLLENKLSFKSADSFYRAVKEIIKQDMNKQDTLTAISIDWLGAVKSLSSNWEETEMYLKSKGLIKNIMEK